MFIRALDRLEAAMALRGDAWKWFTVGLALPAAALAWWVW